MTSAAWPAVPAPERIHVEVAYAEPGRQFLVRIELPSGASIADAVRVADVESQFGIDAGALAVGIWSKLRDWQTEVRDGDRVELYRPLMLDPKEARRLRARGRPG